MTKLDFPMLIVCAVGVIAGIGLLSLPQMASGTVTLSDKARATTAVSSPRALELSAELARHHLTLVCPDSATHADLTYQRALMPDSFAASADDTVQTRKCYPRPAQDRDFGQVMHN